MHKFNQPVVSEHELQCAGNCIPVGSDDWMGWLASNKAFCYNDRNGHFTARCETRRGKPYWYAYRRQNGKLAKVYLGKSEELTPDRLKEANMVLSGAKPELPHSPPATPAFPGVEHRFDTSLLFVAKTNGPMPPPHLVSRPRLTNQIKTPVTLVYAPSGFGKSTLLNEWKQNCNFPVAWLSLDEEDKQPLRFWKSVVLSLQTVVPGFGSKALIYLNGPSMYQLSESVTLLLNELAQATTTLPALGLVIDDVHHINNSEILDTLQAAIDHLPPRIRLIFAGRTRLPLAYGHLRSQGLITELEAKDLRFTQDEAAHYIKQYTQSAPLSNEDIAELAKHTEGWAAGLTLSVLAMSRQEDQRRFIDTFSGAHIYMRDYFMETVLQRTSPEVQYFLLRTAILKHLTGSLCDALTGWHNGEEILEQIWQKNLFVEKLEQQGWYRYHDLFAEMLSSQLQARYPQEVAQLHRRAAQWYREHYALGEAVNHLLAIEAWEEASGLIEEVALRELEQNGEDSRLLRWLENLPESVVQKHKTLLSLYLSLASSALSRKQIERFVSAIDINLSHSPAALLSNAEQEVLEEIQQIRQAWAQGENHRPTLTNRSPDDDRWALYQDFQDLYFTHPSYSLEMAQGLPILLDRARKTHNLFMILMAGGAFTHSLYLEGQIRYAERIAWQVLHDATNIHGSLPEPASICLATLGLVHLTRNEIALAQKYLDQAGEVDPNPTSTNMPILLAILRSKIQVLLGNFDAASKLLLMARELQNRHPANSWTEQDLLAYTARVALRKGDLSVAQDLLDSSVHLPAHPLSQLVQAEIFYDMKKPEAAETILKRLLAENPHGRHYEPLFDARILLAQALFQQRQYHQACQTIVEFIRYAAAERIMLPFLERSAEISVLLELVLATETLSRDARDFIDDLLAKLPPANEKTRMNELMLTALSTAASISPRQQEILQLISEGYSFREVAVKLYIAESTVKTHLSNIYQKLGVRSRTQAINRAKELDLIHVLPTRLSWIAVSPGKR
ncbi:MAG TPA: LuxR C-terminal-related transcriptional regulator [Anaerolineae bacterium]|jgi:LuxR family maltose regulon positive regulatory protein